MVEGHITFIGMPGVGKTTLGKAVAKSSDRKFLDLDKVMESRIGMTIKSYIDAEGAEAFRTLEEQTVMELELDGPTIISTGGSVIYSEKAMGKLKELSTIVYLKDKLPNIKNRLGNYRDRGIIGLGEKNLDQLFEERCPLYERFANLTFQLPDSFHKSHIVDKLNTLLA